MRCARGLNFPTVKNRHLVKREVYLVDQMRRPEHTDAAFRSKRVNVFDKFTARRNIQANRRFIEQQQLWVVQQSARQFHPAAVSAIEPAHATIDRIEHIQSTQLTLDRGLRRGA